MKISMAFSLFLSSRDHNFNAALQLYGPPAMFANNIVPALPLNVVTETNQETLAWMRQDLAWIDEQLLTAIFRYLASYYRNM